MEVPEMTSKNEALRSRIAIRCAKSAMLLSSLRSFQNSTVRTGTDDDMEEETTGREMADLRIRLMREEKTKRKIKLCGLMELILLIMLVLLLSTFLLMLALESLWKPMVLLYGISKQH